MRTKNVLLFTFFFLLFIAAFLPIAAVSAQQPTPSDDEVNAIARHMYCPVCENIPLDVCPTTACHQWRELIRQMLAEGKSAAEIEQYFVDYYGARVLSEPPRTGIYWLAYVVPLLAFLAGASLLFMAFRTWRRMGKEPITGTDRSSSPGSRAESENESGIATPDEYVTRLEEELRKRK